MKFDLLRFLAMAGMIALLTAAVVGAAVIGVALGVAFGGWWVVGRW